jgi:hypothetical protein
MRKLRMLLVTVVMATAALAATAGTAQADIPFWMSSSPGGDPCDPICQDDGLEGELGTYDDDGTPLATCETAFDMVVEANGAFETEGQWVGNCQGHWAGDVDACDSGPWQGQIRRLDLWTAWVELDVCVEGAGGYEDWEDITLQVTVPGGVRTWTQISEPDIGGPGYVDGMVLQDTNNAVNAYMVLPD